MDQKEFEKLNDDLVKMVSGGTLHDSWRNMVDLMVPYYRSLYPEISLDEFLNRVLRKSYPEYHLEAASEEDIADIREYIAHYWD